jgi:glycosyltransferase involved in cell wall biosynthesis
MILAEGERPKVSIIIPVYNGGDYLASAVDSALSQTYANSEVLVINDGSNDDGLGERIAKSYGSALRYFSKPNGGVASALNFGLQHMKGNYFSWLSHDDLYAKNKIERQMQALLRSAHPENTIVCSDYSLFSSTSSSAVPVRLPPGFVDHFRYAMTMRSCVHGCTLLIPRSAFEKVGRFDENLLTTQDYDLWFRMAETYRFVHVPEVLVHARHHAQQGTRRLSGAVISETSQMLVKFIGQMSAEEITSATGKDLGSSYLAIASRMWARGMPQAAKCARDLALQHGSSLYGAQITETVAKSRGALISFAKLFLDPMTVQKIKRPLTRARGRSH